MAWSATLARAWLATVWLVGTVEVSCGRHSSRLGSERVWLGRVYPGLIVSVLVVLSEAEAGYNVAAAGGSPPCRQGACGASTAWCDCRWLWRRWSKEVPVDGGMGRGCGCRRCWACRTMAWSDSLARAWLATELLMGLVEACCGRHSSRLGSERVGLGRVCPGLLACMCCRVGGDHGVAGKLWGRLPLVSVGLCRVGRGRTASTARFGCAGSGGGRPWSS